MWVHTEPENNSVWSFYSGGGNICGTRSDGWQQISILDLSSTNGINKVKSNSQVQLFKTGNLNNFIGSGEGTSLVLKEILNYRCWEPELISTIVGANPQAITNINKRTLQTFTFRFSTHNDYNDWVNKFFKRTAPSSIYLQLFKNVHRTNQKYVLEFFVPTGSSDKFVVFEEISIKDLTNYNKSVIKSTYGDIQIDANDIKSIFLFFKDLSRGLASRNSTITSGTMEVSGGSRLNYRSNVDMYPNTRDTDYRQLEEIQIHEG